MLTLSGLDRSPVRQGVTSRDCEPRKHSFTLLTEAFGLGKPPA